MFPRMPSRRSFLKIAPIAAFSTGTPVTKESSIASQKNRLEGLSSLIGGNELSTPINAAAFGLDMTGATFSDAGWKDCLDYVRGRRTNPTELSGWGQDIIQLPKGILKLRDGYSPNASVIGMTIKGAGKYATTIEFHNDVSPLFNLTTNIAFTLQDLSINHIPQDTNRSEWTNCVIQRTGAGGGNELHLDKVTTRNWNIIDNNTGTENNDTTRFSFCRFVSTRCVLYGRSSQAVINKFDQCSFVGRIENLLDIAGYGYTVLQSCNIVVDGTWLSLADVPSLYGTTSTIVFRDCKGEPCNSTGLVDGAMSKLITVVGASAFVSADVHFENCGFSSAQALDPTIHQFSVTPSVRITWRGGDLMTTAKIETVANANEQYNGKAGILFEDMRSAPPPSSVIRTSGLAESGHPSITWRNCRGLPNLTIATRSAYVRDAEQVNRLTASASGALNFGTDNLSLPFYGGRQRIKEILLHLDAKIGGSLTVDAYSDSARTMLIGTITLSSADNTANPLVRRLSAATDMYVSEGLYFTVTAASAHHGHIQVTHVCS